MMCISISTDDWIDVLCFEPGYSLNNKHLALKLERV